MVTRQHDIEKYQNKHACITDVCKNFYLWVRKFRSVAVMTGGVPNIVMCAQCNQ